MSGGSFFRLLEALVKPLMSLYRWWRPVSDRASIAVLSDELSAAVQRGEQRLQRELRASGHDLMQVEFTTTALPPRDAGPVQVKDIAAYFELLGNPGPHRRRLVVLGAPGSGKTVAATYLALGLLESRQQHDDAPRANVPVPVRVNAAGWDGKQDFTRWLIIRLGHDFRLRPNVAREIVDRGLILPVIDGLDEMDGDSAGSRAKALLDRLNRAPWRDRPVIVMCRTTEFEALARLRGDNGLHGGTTLTLQPLATSTVSEYLSAHPDETGTGHPGWTQVITHIADHPSGVLATCVRTPWMLGLTATTLHHTPHIADQLISCTTEAAVRDLLFAAQIPAAVAATDEGKPYRDYTSDNVERWVQSLARCLQQRRDTGRDGAAIRLDEVWEIAGFARIRLLHTLVVGLVVGLLVGLIAGLMGGPMVGFVDELWFGLVGGLVSGLVVGLRTWATPFRGAARVAWSVPTRSRWKKGVTAGLVLVLVLVVVAVFVGGLVFVLDEAFGGMLGQALDDALGDTLLFVLMGTLVIVPVGVLGVVLEGKLGDVLEGKLGDVLVGALLFVFVFVFMYSFGARLGELGVALVLVLVGGFVFGLTTGLETNTKEQLALGADERRLIRDDIQAATFRAISIGLVVGLVFGLVFGYGLGDRLFGFDLWFGLVGGLVGGLAVGISGGIPVGLMAGGAAGRFCIAVVVFRFTKRFPKKPAVFLDWARRSGLLRVNGTAYQFRHETYQQWIQQPRSSQPSSCPPANGMDRAQRPVS